jgi:hypothetical protein
MVNSNRSARTIIRTVAVLVYVTIASSSTPTSATTNAILDILQNTVWPYNSSSCEPNLATDNSYYYFLYGQACCGSPGRGPCSVFKQCVNGETYTQDPIDGNYYCSQSDISPEVTDLLPATRPATGADFTFYVTSDMHFFRNNYDTDMQIFHVDNINRFASSGELWPTGAGIPQIPISPPTAIVVPGDLGMCGGPEMLGGYRLVWEKGSATGSINYPVYIGLGNHDLIAGGAGCTDATNAERLWYYLHVRSYNLHSDRNPTGCLVNVDSNCSDFGGSGGSHNYSWDWHGAHMVMLNTWAGESNREYLHAQYANGIAWLANDLAHYVGTTNAPVILFQHYTLGDVYPAGVTQDGYFEWSSSDYHRFWNVIKNYNVIGIFSGHTHSLGTDAGDIRFPDGSGPSKIDRPAPLSDKFASVAQGWNTPFIDNFIDGNGGACNSELCSGNNNGSANFLVARVTDHYLDVTAISENENVITTVGDTAMRFPGKARACRKRINSPYTVLSDKLFADSTGYHYQNASAVPIYGPVAITYTGLTEPDFVDTCTSSAGTGNSTSGNGYKMILEDGEVLQPGGDKLIDLSSDHPDVSNITLYSLHDTLETTLYSSTNAGSGPKVTNVTVGAIPIDIYVQTHLHQYKAFTFTSDVNWLSISEDDTNHSFPTILTLSLISSSAQGTGHVTITPEDTSIPPVILTITPYLSQITVASIPGGRIGQIIYVDNIAYVAPHSFLWLVGSQHTLDASHPSGTPGARQTFVSWSGGQPISFAYTVPPATATLTATFNMSYLLSWSTSGSGTLVASPLSADGYYASGSQVSVTAVPASGYFLQFFGGALSGAANPQALTIYKPIAVAATFSPDPRVTVTAVPSNAVIYIDNVAYQGSSTFVWPAGSTHTLDASKTEDGGGTHQAFASWSISGPSKLSYRVPTGNANITGHFNMFYFLTVAVAGNGALAQSPLSPDGYYMAGTQVTLTATPAANYTFTGFTGALNGATNPQMVTMSQPQTVGLSFTPIH